MEGYEDLDKEDEESALESNYNMGNILYQMNSAEADALSILCSMEVDVDEK